MSWSSRSTEPGVFDQEAIECGQNDCMRLSDYQAEFNDKHARSAIRVTVSSRIYLGSTFSHSVARENAIAGEESKNQQYAVRGK
jgi:hypothetical protein